jgi:gamma-glutamyl-gamma-aminobutyrate hydrolase PuuD
MPDLPRVGLTRWEHVQGEQIEAYQRRLRAAGLEPVDLASPADSLRDCAGLVLTGGVDIDPSLYRETPAPQTQAPIPARDEYELGLLRAALDAGLPVLAICRGHQLLNIALGGSLMQHIESGEHASHREPPRLSRSHEIDLAPGTLLADLYAGRERFLVNSRHHQAVTPGRLAPGLRVAAVSPDGLVEAVESERHPWVVAVQWHPERDDPEIEGFAAAGQRLFSAFAAAVTA